MSEKMTKCKSCNNDLASSAKNCPNCGAKNKKPIFKKWWFWLIVVFILIAIIGGAGGEEKADKDVTISSTSNNSESQAVAETAKSEENTIGRYQVEIKNARITSDYEGKPVVVITYGFTNNSEEPTSFSFAFDETVYQNDIGLNGAYVLKNGDPYSSDNQTKEIKKGATLDVDVAYELNDTESDVVVEVEELFGWTDEKVTKIFSIK